MNSPLSLYFYNQQMTVTLFILFKWMKGSTNYSQIFNDLKEEWGRKRSNYTSIHFLIIQNPCHSFLFYKEQQICKDNQCSLLEILKQNCNIHCFLVFLVELNHKLPLRTIPISTRTLLFITFNFYSVTLICVKAGAARSVCQVQAVAGVSSNARQSEQRKETTKYMLWKGYR